VGRLDANSEGLLLLSNDGDLAYALTHPRHEVDKTYLAVVAGQPTEEALDRLRAGIELADGATAPARVRVTGRDREANRTTLEIVIHEGRNRQIRRMCEAIGHPVERLKRVKLAFLTLEGVKRGHYRHLTPEEVAELRRLAGGGKG